LSIIDLSDAGRQPMESADGRYRIAFNGEIYNYLELRQELRDYPFGSETDTEVILAAFEKWGPACLDRFIGMFAIAIWDQQQRRLFAARDRFGVKPVYYHCDGQGGLALASEIKALHAAGVPAVADAQTWSTFLVHGLYEHSERTFWENIVSLPPGYCLVWDDHQTQIRRWYDLADSVGADYDDRPQEVVAEEYFALLKESVKLRFRSDVTVAVNLSGGLDSSLLLGLIHAIQGTDSEVRVFTFATGDPAYDELPWVQQMLAKTRHPLTVGMISPSEVPELAQRITAAQDEPFGGLPTLAYANLFAEARRQGVTVLLDGQGMDEAWAGYDYYAAAMTDDNVSHVPTVQGTRTSITRTDTLVADFRDLAPPKMEAPNVFPDALRRLQYRDARHTKIPRALRFNDRVSMAASTELREPFLDHRLFELALKQPPERKRDGDTGKRLLRKIAQRILPEQLRLAPKRPLQTPQREWLRDPLRDWASGWIDAALSSYGGVWLDADQVNKQWLEYQQGESDNSFFVWQWISLGLCSQLAGSRSYVGNDQ
jgi:asparagine synthase (glutamine-hydrolysing)